MSQPALKKHSFDDFIYALEVIEASDNGPHEIFEVAHLEKSVGYITIHDLKTLFTESDSDWNEYTFRRSNEKQFKSIYEIPNFQRRKPQIVASETVNDTDDEFYLLIKGQKSGPYNISQIKEQLENKEILLNELVSTNAGHSWVKLYQLDIFDRRILKPSDSLPGLPTGNFFEGAAGAQSKNSEDALEAITGLAYLGNIKRGKAIEREREEHLEEAIKKNSSSGSIYKMILFGSILGILYMANSLRNSLKSPFKSENEENRIGEQIDSPPTSPEPNSSNNFKQNIQNDSFSRGPKFETRNLNPVRPAKNLNRSFTETKNFQEQFYAPASTGDDSTYYYNDTAPMELDPVRQNISKDTAMPESIPSQSSDPLFNQEVDN